MGSRRRAQYVTEDRVIVYEGDLVYDYYTMEPVVIAERSSAGDDWFEVRKPGTTERSSAGMLNGQRICSIEYAAMRDFPGAKAILAKTMAK